MPFHKTIHMQTLTQFLFLISVLTFVACGGETTNTSSTTDNTNGITPNLSTEEEPAALAHPTTHDCKISGSVLEDNQVWLQELNTLVAIVADSTTFDQDLGDSHRVLEVYNTNDCSLTKRIELPVNISPDYAYYLAKVNYNNLSKLVGIMAFNSIYIYDVEAQKLLDPIKPTYLSKRNLDDAQSGLIQHLELWENYLIGYAQDGGAFVIDLSDKNTPQAMTAFAEYQLEDGTFSSLFMLPSGNQQQVIIPKFDYENGDFSINPLFQTPRAMNTQISKGARNNRFIILREQNEKQPAVLVDLTEFKQMDVPDEVANKKTKTILDWAKKNS